MILRIIFPKYTEQFKAIFIFLVILFCEKNNYGQRFISDNYEYRDNLRINAKTGVAEVMYSTDNISYEGIPEETVILFQVHPGMG